MKPTITFNGGAIKGVALHSFFITHLKLVSIKENISSDSFVSKKRIYACS